MNIASLTEYEQQRERNIARNNARLREVLGSNWQETSSELFKKKRPAPGRKKVYLHESTSTLRRSARVVVVMSQVSSEVGTPEKEEQWGAILKSCHPPVPPSVQKQFEDVFAKTSYVPEDFRVAPPNEDSLGELCTCVGVTIRRANLTRLANVFSKRNSNAGVSTRNMLCFYTISWSSRREHMTK